MADEINNGLQVQSTQGHEDEVVNVAGLKASLQKFKTEKVDPLQWPMVAVAELPTATASTMHKIYLVPSTNPKQKNAKDEFITIATTETVEEQEVTTYSWEQIGSTTVDLSNYATLQALSDAIAAVRAEDVAVTTLNAAPTSSTTSYTKGGQSVDFKIGDEVRVADAEQATEGANGYVYYKLYDLVDNQGTKTAYWDLIGAGGGDVTGRIKVSIATYVNDIAASASLLGNVTVTLTNTTDSTTVETKTWNGSDITFTKLTPLKDYRVTVEDKTGWLRNKSYEDITNLGIGEEKTATFTYSADEYTCSVSGTADGRIVVSGTEYANNATFRVAKGTSITATAKVVANYVTPTPSISGKTISATYVAYGVLTVVTTSNQDETGTPDATIAAVSPTVKVGDAAAVTYSAPMPIAPDASVEVEWPAVTGYTAPSKQTFTMPSTDTSKSGEYATEILTVTVNQEDGQDADISGVTVTVTDQTASAAVTAGQDGKYKIPGGHTYLVTVSDVQGYITPTHTAETACAGGRKTNTVTMTYVYNPISYAYIKFDQTKSDETQMITVSETENGTAQTLNTTTGQHANAALQALRDASHLYMGKASNGSMALRQLKDNDGTKYADDNSTANMDGTDGDHYLRIGVEFYLKRVSGSDSGNQVTYCLAVGGQPEGTGWKQIITPNDLLAVHEATATDTTNNTSGTLRSISGGQSTGNISQANFKQKARNGGTGFSLVTWEWHNIMALLFYAWYGRTNAQAQCGTGADTNARTLGTKDSLGMTDTDSTNGNTDNTKFWGIENWWGCKYEWIDNVVVDARVWKVTDKEGTQRTAGTGASSSQYITKMLLSENLDLIPTAASGGSETTYYCDYYSQSSSSSRVVLRSNYSAGASGGVACVNASGDSSGTGASVGSRLAFNGTIVEASVMKLRFRTANESAVTGAPVTVTTPTGTETHVTDANGEITVMTLPGTCTLSCLTHDLNISQFTATSGQHTVDIVATEKPLETGYIILDQTSSDPTTKVLDEDGHTYSNYTRPSVIDSIRAASHCYVGTFANNKMTLKQLSDSNGTLYADGTSASTDITTTGKDVFMRLPFFFTRVSEYATDKIKIEFAFDAGQTATSTRQPSGNGWKQWGGNDLIGKYKGYSTSSLLYSVSGQASTASISQANFKSYARSRGTGYTIVKWRHQNIMAILFYAYYGHTNCQTLIGSGANSKSRTTGQKNSLGMTDTTSSNGNTDNIVFWGLENWWGDLYEWVDNVVVNNGTWTITEDDNTTRTINASDTLTLDSSVYPYKFILGDGLDVIGATGQTGGTDSTGYCDYQYVANNSSRVVRRSGSYAYASGGVACVYAYSDSSGTSAGSGSRLAFKGTIEIA